MTTILSYGGGTNSTALLLEWVRKGKDLDAVIFADTGSEQPFTYELFDTYIKPYCSDHGIPFETVYFTAGPRVKQVKEGTWEVGQQISIYDYYHENKMIPALKFRSCTSKFKIQPIEKILKEKYPDSIQLIGIDSGETRRAKRVRDPKTGEWIYLYPEKKYPLIDWDIDREGCSKIIADHGWPSPDKSGCYFCPFQAKKQWLKLYNESPDLFNLSMELEQNGKEYPKWSLAIGFSSHNDGKAQTLDQLRKQIETQTSLFDFGDLGDDRSIPCDCYDG